MNPTSPLTGTDDVEWIEDLKSRDLLNQWKANYGIDIGSILNRHEHLQKFRCKKSDLVFFMPKDCLGGEEFYADLQKFPWYYIPEKWEHLETPKYLEGLTRILEVGCGTGHFVAQLKRLGFEVLGIELNRAAVEVATMQHHLPVANEDVADISKKHLGQFDAVCHFQVLEHIADPLGFLQHCVDCLKTGGLLIVAVPNMDGFVGQAKNDLLNQPPHHATQWSSKALQGIADYLPIELVNHEFEPLAKYHAGYWAHTQLHSFFGWPSIPIRFMVSAMAIPIGWLASLPFLRTLIFGHTQLAVFRKIA